MTVERFLAHLTLHGGGFLKAGVRSALFNRPKDVRHFTNPGALQREDKGLAKECAFQAKLRQKTEEAEAALRKALKGIYLIFDPVSIPGRVRPLMCMGRTEWVELLNEAVRMLRKDASSLKPPSRRLIIHLIQRSPDFKRAFGNSFDEDQLELSVTVRKKSKQGSTERSERCYLTVRDKKGSRCLDVDPCSVTLAHAIQDPGNPSQQQKSWRNRVIAGLGQETGLPLTMIESESHHWGDCNCASCNRPLRVGDRAPPAPPPDDTGVCDFWEDPARLVHELITEAGIEVQPEWFQLPPLHHKLSMHVPNQEHQTLLDSIRVRLISPQNVVQLCYKCHVQRAKDSHAEQSRRDGDLQGANTLSPMVAWHVQQILSRDTGFHPGNATLILSPEQTKSARPPLTQEKGTQTEVEGVHQPVVILPSPPA